MNPSKIHLRYGLVTGIVLIAYFLIVKLFGAHENVWLRLLNGLIVGYGIFAAIRLRKTLEGKTFDYYNGFRTGVYTGALATVIFVGFMAVYMYHLDPSFAEGIMDKWLTEYKQGPGILLFVITVEGLASSVVLALTFMQKFKNTQNLSKNTA